MVKLIQDEIYKSNLDTIIDRSKKGLPTLIIVFGPTRSGKTTIVAQSAKYIADGLGVEYTVENNIFFDAEHLLNESKNKKYHQVWHIDEAAFSLMGEDWQNKIQKDLIKLQMTAAKYAWVTFIIIPFLEKLRDTFVRDEHTRGIETYFGKNNQKGYFMILDQYKIMYKHFLLKGKKFSEAKRVVPSHRGRFNSNMGFLDIDAYERKKDDAISKIGNEEKKDKWKEAFVKLCSHLINEKSYTKVKIAKICSISHQRLSDIIPNSGIMPNAINTSIVENQNQPVIKINGA